MAEPEGMDATAGAQRFAYAAAAQSILFGPGTIAELPAAVSRFGWRRLLLCTSPSQVRNGTAGRVRALLAETLGGVYDQVLAHVQAEQVAAATVLAQEIGADAVIGLGGGSSVGMAKAVSIELERRRHSGMLPPAQPLQAAAVPAIAIPTTYAGSEMTAVVGVTGAAPAVAGLGAVDPSMAGSSMAGSGGGSAEGAQGTAQPPRKVTLTDPRITPRLVLYDPELTLDLPPAVTAATGINALAHAVEALYSTTRNPLSTAAATAAIGPIFAALPRCFAQGDDLPARTRLLRGAHLAGAALATVAMGVHHGTCHVLGGTLGVPHALAHSIMLPYAVRFNLPWVAAALGPAADALHVPPGDAVTRAAAVAAAIAALTQRLGLPQRLAAAGVRHDDLPLVAEQMLLSPAVRANPRPVPDVATALELLEAAW